MRWSSIINIVFYKHLKRNKSVTITLVQQMDMGMKIVEEMHLKRYMRMYLVEKTLFRPQIVSGTHAISTALFGLLRPHDELLYITDRPYDTLGEVIGKRGEESG